MGELNKFYDVLIPEIKKMLTKTEQNIVNKVGEYKYTDLKVFDYFETRIKTLEDQVKSLKNEVIFLEDTARSLENGLEYVSSRVDKE